mgnify:CR=1 FL=1
MGNMTSAKIVVDGVEFKTSEQLYQMMKFKDAEIVSRVWKGITAADKKSANIKMTAKSYEPTHRRADWGEMIVDAIKYCMVQKYEQCEAFRQELERSRGLYIAEQQANPKKPADTWSAKKEDDHWVGPNLTGRLLMELRDTGKLTYSLPADAFAFLEVVKGV